MRVRLTLPSGDSLEVPTPLPGADHAVAPGACPGCGVTPWRVRGTGRRIESRDTYAADAESACCGAPVGTLRAQVVTIFGLEEDRAVLEGRARVYS